ncbi:bifunctional adenosylcobinamide kinase/adenosylcobinamide-phosphate guanylyltransferase [Streptococcus sanguinis]|uniref:bifunctional adenosylcobinamide kinase/adenosylcobinamide-phosphate guanylyltransferase n=1 Tax=Streptococcus sanguinis TaxID=1305 RepID=UPI001CBDB18D|nr:bifunctional adenosylcobinamide kinase/adenosylcobinamide-phosphate guanylyltransferase [Streptococcus sanguinis]MBZ2023294.1 bifunctional adenosylcobinamide kinase/adenosylcobinamide-phosphate guanylyltransferase [Streptococcus sanguinis]MBZ2048124.1 bifunctional adenosylcobinamide kinase/adenosylcobinamide-phosphate guanylyltransferase [Streptococcus sanguinis]MBZ2050583.1 bifunctional adenosylcobinamide kinase/adenosylcobinamide-phosphate guanylyltransferase [Streptococcus sanguinis]MBZ20
MAKIVLVTGGARSGKSAFAEEKLADRERVCYIATGLPRGEDPEWQERIRLHQERRPASWTTQEQYAGLADWLREQSHPVYLLDCATLLTSNRLFDLIAQHFPDKLELSEEHFLSRQEQSFLLQLLEEEWQELLSTIRQTNAECWIVTDEVGLGIVPETRLGRFFRDVQGKINQLIAKEASEAYLVICGLAQQLK